MSDTEIKKRLPFIPLNKPEGQVKPADLRRSNVRKILETELSKEINGITRAEGLVARLVTMGIQGNLRAIELIMAYMYGKPQAQVQESDSKPFVLELTEGEKDETENQESNETN
jgi:hypothetical protein